MSNLKQNTTQPQKRKKEAPKHNQKSGNNPQTPKKKDKDKKQSTLKENPLIITQVNLNHAKVPSLTLQENLDQKWNTDLKHIICIQEHWLFNFELDKMAEVHHDYEFTGKYLFCWYC